MTTITGPWAQTAVTIAVVDGPIFLRVRYQHTPRERIWLTVEVADERGYWHTPATVQQWVDRETLKLPPDDLFEFLCTREGLWLIAQDTLEWLAESVVIAGYTQALSAASLQGEA